MNKRDYDRRDSYHKHKHHGNGCQFFYDSNSLRGNSKENNTSQQNSFYCDDFDLLEEKEYRRRFKRMRYNNRHSGSDV